MLVRNHAIREIPDLIAKGWEPIHNFGVVELI